MGPLIVSTSEARTLRQCARRYQYEYVMGRRPTVQAHDAVWGAALHRGLEALFRGGEHRAYAVDFALSSGTDGNGRAFTPPADPYARAALSAMLRAYVEVWHTDAADYEVMGVETAFCLPIKNRKGALLKGRACEACNSIGVWLDQRNCPSCSGSGRIRPMREGRMDLVVRECSSGSVLIVEHKSTSWLPADERYYTGIELDLQTALYFDAAREMGLAPAGVMMDVIRRPAYDEPKPEPKRAGKEEVRYSNPRFGESPASYEDRIYRLALSEPGAWFGRRLLEITEEQIIRSREIMHGAADEIRWRERTNHYPMTGDRYVCAPSKRVCPWLDVCAGRASAEDDTRFPRK